MTFRHRRGGDLLGGDLLVPHARARMPRALLGFCLCVAIQLLPWLALGQGLPADRALANDLFQRGRQALLEQRYADACPLLEESQRLDPAGGTLLNLALCHENLGQTATAWTEFHDALAIARHERRQDRAEFALAHIAALESRLSRLVVEPEAPLAEGLVIERDGSPLSAAVWGKPMPVDPGTHAIRARAAGFESFERSVHVGDAGDTQTVNVPALRALPAVTVPPPVPQVPPAPESPLVTSPAPPPTETPEPAPLSPERAQWKRPLAWSLFAVSLAAAVSATVTGVRAIRLRNEAEGRCEDDLCPNHAFALDDKARRLAHASTALTVLSALSGGAGLVVWFVDGRLGSVRDQSAQKEPSVTKMQSLGIGFVRSF